MRGGVQRGHVARPSRNAVLHGMRQGAACCGPGQRLQGGHTRCTDENYACARNQVLPVAAPYLASAACVRAGKQGACVACHEHTHCMHRIHAPTTLIHAGARIGWGDFVAYTWLYMPTLLARAELQLHPLTGACLWSCKPARKRTRAATRMGPIPSASQVQADDIIHARWLLGDGAR